MTHRHFIIHKPFGMLSQFINSKKRKKTVLGELHDFPPKTMAIGRLDVDSEGLLLLTTDGKMSHKITSQKVEKEYYVQVDGDIDEAAVERLKNGVEITVKGRAERYQTLPCKAFKLAEPPNFPPRTKPIRGHHHGPTSWVSITLKEGKNRQVRKMTAAVGFPTLRLFRVRIGEVELSDLPAGGVVETPFFNIDFGENNFMDDLDLKIAFTDIDGTLLNKKREISEALKVAVNAISNKDIPFILISSRMPSAMTHLQNDLNIKGLPLICYNGGLVLLDGKSIHSTEIPVKTIEAIADLNTEKTFHISLYNHDDWYVESMDFWAKREQHNTKVTPTVQPIDTVLKNWKTAGKGAHKIMCMGEKTELDRVVAALDNQFSDSLHLYRSKDTYLEIANKDISKLTGIEVLLAAKYPDLTLENSIAFGDNFNDIEMLEAVKVGVAVQNAKPAVLASADVVTDANHRDGVAKAIELYF